MIRQYTPPSSFHTLENKWSILNYQLRMCMLTICTNDLGLYHNLR